MSRELIKERLKKQLQEREKPTAQLEKKEGAAVATSPAQTLNLQPDKNKSALGKAPPESSYHLLRIARQNLDLAIVFIFQLKKRDLGDIDVERLLIRAFGLFNAAKIVLEQSDITPESSSNLAITYWNLAWITEIFKKIDCHYAKAESTKVYFDKAVTTNAKSTIEEATNRSYMLIRRGSHLYDDFKKRLNLRESANLLSYVSNSAENYFLAGINISQNLIYLCSEEMLLNLNQLIALCFTELGNMNFALGKTAKHAHLCAFAWQFYKNTAMLANPPRKIKIKQLPALYSAAKQLLPNTDKEEDFLFRPVTKPFADEDSSKSFSC